MDTRPTPTHNRLPFRAGDFSCLAEALDYAATGDTGCNFYDGRGGLSGVLTYAALREDAQRLARRLAGLGLARGARVALVADTDPDFIRLFFACQYAGLAPVTLPASIHLGSHQAYVRQLRRLLTSSRADVVIAAAAFTPFLAEAAESLRLRFLGTAAEFAERFEDHPALSPLQGEEVACIQYTSGTTRAVRGVVVTQRALMSNLFAIVRHGIDVRPGDRAVSWLPFYHDMGFVGFVLAPMAAQISVDYLGTVEFAKRPQQWLRLMSRTQATISFGPSFGYELCARRLRPAEASELDLRAWRVAGVGAEMIRPDLLERIADLLAPSGFDRRAFVACYGMAECSLAVSFAPLGAGIKVDRVDRQHLAEAGIALPVDDTPDGDDSRVSTFVNCGVPLPDHDVEVLDDSGRSMPDRWCGTIFVRGPSVMSGYFEDPDATNDVLAADGWLDTGDLGYRVDRSIVITGRKKDLLIIKGRNIWPQDLEAIAEQQPELRTGAAAAFSVIDRLAGELAVMVVQCRVPDPEKRKELVQRLHGLILEEFGIHCLVELVPPHTLPRTSSGKLSRAGARARFLKSHDLGTHTSWRTSSR